jgi:hypothetical protein
MAVPGKHLFWIAIIIVELVFVYVLWKPIRAHWRPSQRAALTHQAVRKPDVRQSEIRQPEVRQPETRRSETPGLRRPEAHLSQSQHQQRAAVPSSEIATVRKPFAPVATIARKPSAAITNPAVPERKRVVINAGLKTPEPVPAKPTPVATPPSGPLDSFWCNISHFDTTCDCKGKDSDQTANLVVR